MTVDLSTLWAFLLVFARCSAMLFTSPVIGGPSVPTNVRAFTALALAAALSTFVVPQGIAEPSSLADLGLAVGHEVLMGLTLGLFVNLAFTAFSIAGAILDLQIGLGSSQLMNPVTGVSSTLISRFKSTLSLVIFVAMDGHHLLIRSFAESYSVRLAVGGGAPELVATLLSLLTTISLLALQMAAPVMAVGIVVDTALGIVNRAVPNMPVLIVGMPAKIGLGLVVLGVSLPALVGGVDVAVDAALEAFINFTTPIR